MATFKTDLEIAQEARLRPIGEIAAKLGIIPDHLEQYGKYKAKLSPEATVGKAPDAKLILVTAINPTPAGEGKTTVSIGLADALSRMGKKTAAALREPSLGPVFGVKGGAAGGGYAQVVPMEDLNLHFTGDLHAITAANNLLAAMLDNHLFFGNRLNIDPKRITWKRCMDMNDRALRSVIEGVGVRTNGVMRQDSFDITAASEVMATLCLAADLADLKERLKRLIVAYNTQGKPVTAGDLNAQGAMAALLKDAVKPNLVQTLEGTPALIHGGPFANIAHGCNSVIATRCAMSLADYVVTEAGFGADLGAEKFLDIKCRMAGLAPNAVVIVATARALKSHGGVAKENLSQENLPALEKGLSNLCKHIENMQTVYHLPVVVAVNRFASDTEEELRLISDRCEAMGVHACLTDVWARGGAGATELAEHVAALCETPSAMTFCYEDDLSLSEKITAIAKRIYGAEEVTFLPAAQKALAEAEALGYGKLPVCIAKTQYSLSDNPALTGRPEGFTVTVREARISAGAGFIVALTGDIMTMPGLPRVPAAEKIDIDANGKIEGLF